LFNHSSLLASEARAVNNAGVIVGDLYSAGTSGISPSVSFRYVAGSGTQTLATFGGRDTTARDINGDGYVVGNAHGTDDRAILWRPDNSVVDLEAWLNTTSSADGLQWTLQSAYGINSLGAIVGYGMYSDGPGGLSDGQRAFILDASALVPEPSALCLLLLIAPAVVRARST
jgi:hypothetical protein